VSCTIRIALKWGVLLGVAICVWGIVVHLLGFYTTRLEYAQPSDVAATILPIAAITAAIVDRRRRSASRAFRIRDGIAAGVATGMVSAPIAATYYWVYHHVINPRWLDLLVAYTRRQMLAAHATPQAIDRRVATLRASGTDAAQLAGALIGTLVLSLLIATLVSLAVRFAMSRSRA
jgi:uncharacterized membrane protein YkvI